MAEILKVDANISKKAIYRRAAEILATGGVVAYPTETFYGLGADATNENAVKKIFDLKGRNFKNPISIIIDREESLETLVENVPTLARKLIHAFWPGPLTIVFNASDKIITILTGETGKIGIRISSHRGATAIVQELGHPLTATSANLSGLPECSNATDVARQIGNKIDAIIDLGDTPGGKGSTIIDVTFDPPKILRDGVIDHQCLVKYLILY
jgi:L-threonylcarbamoyladenylate synthase